MLGLTLLAAALLLSGRSGDGNAGWRGDLAAGLVTATGLYAPLTTILFALSFKHFTTPGLYRDLVLHRPLLLGLMPKCHPLPYDFYWRLRVLRGWMRTVSNTAESTDLLFALQGVFELVGQYCEEAARDRAAPIRDHPPEEYLQALESPIGRADRVHRGEVEAAGQSWFAYELGRALARSTETGVRGNTLRRDLDRLLDTFVLSIKMLAMKEPNGGQERLIRDAGILVTHLIEVGLGVRQSDQAQHEWYRAPALQLAELHNYLNELARWLRQPEVIEVRDLALAGWLAVTTALQSHDPGGRAAWDAFVEQCMGELGTDADWNAAKGLATDKSFRPHWDIPTQTDTAAIENLVMEVQRLTSAPSVSSHAPGVPS